MALVELVPRFGRSQKADYENCDVGGRGLLAAGAAKIYGGGLRRLFPVAVQNVMKNLKIGDGRFKADWPKGTKVEKPHE